VKNNGGKDSALVWRKAAVLGSLWAASEILLGSFLHNAHIPFSGEFLTAVGIAIMIAGHRLWPERGLLWRAGLVCAAMKSVSPSAVIFGPMFAISAEGFLAEAGVRLLGANPAGYVLAGGLAMCGTLGYKLLRLFMVYGPDTVGVYLRGVEWLRGIGFSGAGDWTPLAAAAGLYFLAGGAAALAGLAAGATKLAPASEAGRHSVKRPPAAAGECRSYSPWALAAHAIFVAAVMAAGRRLDPWSLAGLAGIYACICVTLYPRAAGLIKRAGLWTGVLAASVTAGLVLGSAGAGLYMALRAFLLTMGFAAIGEELLNPVIRRLVERVFGKIFFDTLEYAFASLPGVLAGLPRGKEFFRRPLAALGAAVALAPHLLERTRRQVFLITGGHGSGKSELVAELARLLRAAGKKPGGICAAGLWENGVRSGFDLVNLADGARQPLCRREPGGTVRAGEFRFYDDGLAAGRAALSAGALAGADAVFIDEVGFLELEGGGWAPQLSEVLGAGGPPAVLAVRDYLLEKVMARWRLRPSAVWKTGKIAPAAALEALTASTPAL